MFGFFKKKDIPEEAQAAELYNLIVEKARTPVFYEDYNVPDDVDGRFEMISVHEILLLLCLEQFGEEASELSQQLFDQMFLDMDRSLREMGISDLSVPKHMKRMLHGFNGRTQAYKEAINSEDRDILEKAVRRNVYGTIEQEIDDASVSKMANYIEQQWMHVSALTLNNFKKAENIFIEEGKE